MRRRIVDPPAEVGYPDELGVCWVEDWVGPDERPPPWWSLDRVGDLPVWFQLEARRRQAEARRVWCAERGVPVDEARRLFPSCRPEFRDHGFVREAAEALSRARNGPRPGARGRGPGCRRDS